MKHKFGFLLVVGWFSSSSPRYWSFSQDQAHAVFLGSPTIHAHFGSYVHSIWADSALKERGALSRKNKGTKFFQFNWSGSGISGSSLYVVGTIAGNVARTEVESTHQSRLGC